MQEIPLEQITKRFQLLPESLQEAIFSESGTDAVLKNCMLRDIPIGKIPFIGQLTNRVLLGYLRPEVFAFEIQKETGVDALKATQVAHDIDAEIFSLVRLELKKLYPPTIQTPTVQSQGFTRSQPVVMEPPKPAPHYVVQIPERFKKTAPWPQQPQPQPAPDNSQLITKNKEAVQPTPVPTPITEQKPATPAQSVPPNEAISSSTVLSSLPKGYKLKDSEGPPMDPVVPLPTFIQSKFKTEELGIKNQEKDFGAPSTQEALKNAFGKFTTSSTATGVAQEPASPYRETVEEPKKPAEQKPSAKIQGKVIDLSQF